MGLSTEELAKLAHLARLEAPQNLDLNTVIALFTELEKVDTKNITAMAHPLGSDSAIMRVDKVTETDQRETMQKLNASDATEAGLYLVPPVIE